MKAKDILTHIDRLGMVASHRGSYDSLFKLSNRVRLYLYGDGSWELKTHDIHDWTIDILNNGVLNAIGMSDHELLGRIEEEILKGKLEAM